MGVNEIKQLQLEDQNKGVLLSNLADGGERPQWDTISNKSTAFKTMWRQLERLKVVNGALYREFHDTDTGKTELQLVVPQKKKCDVIHYFHDIPTDMSTLVLKKTLERIKKSFYWPSM